MEMERGKLLNVGVKHLISSWIDGKIDQYNKNNLPYKFQLILQGTRYGFSRSVFEDKCYNIEQTIVIMKIKKTDELIGGYNPVCWNIREKPLNKEYCVTTDKSFIFKINENQPNNSILSRVRYPQHAIFHPCQIYNLTGNNLNIIEINFCFNIYHNGNLQLCKSINNESYCYYRITGTYEPSLNLRNRYQLLEEYEVYKLIN